MKNSISKLLSLLMSAALLIVVSACGDDEPEPAAPSLTSPSLTTVEEGSTTSLSFSITSPGGFVSASIPTVTGGTASVITSPAAAATSGTVEVSFVAGNVDLNQTGTGVVVLQVIDAAGKMGSATITFSITSTDTPPTPIINVRGNIDSDVTWTASNIYLLETRVTVESNATLTIEPGTVIKGAPGQQAASTALLVARGGTLNAQGTAALPIIFTAQADPIGPNDIAAGNYASTTSPTQTGLWGGLIILGNAPISAQNESDQDVTELQIEGIPASDTNGLYGGNDGADNSGTISYISIRHGGTNIGSGNEINGLTLGGVGSGTTISNVEVVANDDDGIEFFGGNVSIDGVVVWNSFDDSMDTDQDWLGTVSNFIIISPRGGSAFELDGPEGSLNRGVNSFTGGVVYGGADIDHIIDWDDNTNTSIQNTYFFGLTAGNVESFGGDGNGTQSNWETDLAAAGSFFAGVASGVITYNIAVGAKTHGPSAADFAWTWAGNSGRLAEIGL